MAMSQTLVQANGPLPIEGNFNSDGDGEVVVFISGSGWRGDDGELSINLYFDGNLVGTAVGFTNEGTSHKALVPVMVPANITYGPHQFVLSAPGTTTTDVNDNFNVVIMY